MAYYLRFAAQDKVDFPELVSAVAPATEEVRIDWALEFQAGNEAGGTEDFIFLGHDSNTTSFIIFRRDTNRLDFRLEGEDFNIPITNSESKDAVYRVEGRFFQSTSTRQWKLFEDGVPLSTFYPSAAAGIDRYDFTQMGAAGGVTRPGLSGFVKRVTYTDNLDASNNRNYTKQALSGSNDTVYPDTVGGKNGALFGFPGNNSQWIFFEDGGTVTPEPELHEFSGSATVNALSFAQISKTTQYNGQSLVVASATASSNKVINISGVATVVAQSVSLFKKLNTFSGNASVNATSQSSASKLVVFNGQAIVNVIASASLIDGNFEIHSFSGGALITASASGQAMKVGIVSGSVNVTASISAQASKTALLSGNATVSTSTQSLLSKIANITGNAITRVTTLAAVLKRVTLSGASRVVATASGTFFNAESNVDTYELTVQGRVKAPIVVQGTVKSTTIQGRVK